MRSISTNEGPRLETMITGFKYGEPIGNHVAKVLEQRYIAQDLALHPETGVAGVRANFSSLPKSTQVAGVAAVSTKDAISNIISRAKNLIRK